MDLPYQLFAVFELLLAVAVSFVIGRIAYEVFFRIAKAFTRRTHTTLDDRLIEACEQPLEIGSIVLFTYILTSYLTSLTGVGALISRYSLAFIFVVGALLLSNIVGAFLRWYYDEGIKHHSRSVDVSLLPLIRKISKVVILFVGITAALGTIGLDITGVFAVTSVVALVVGLASQETLANFFAGLALQLDRQVRYGDYFRFASGDVVRLERIGVRSSQFSDLDGKEVVLSNSEFAKQRVVIVGEKGKPAVIAASVELPHPIKPGEALEFLKSRLKKEKPDWLAAPGVSVSVDRIMEKTYSASFLLTVTDLVHAPGARAFANSEMLDLVRKRRV
ncbi:MAG: mechanosensitive ion channel family protein [Candidatus Micrarchaeota archaeon]